MTQQPKRRMIKWILYTLGGVFLLWVLLFAAGVAGYKWIEASAKDGPTLHMAYHQAVSGLPLPERVISSTPEVTERQFITNFLDYQKPIRPKTVSATHPTAQKLKTMLAALPPGIRRLAEDALLAIYPVEEDFGSATTVGVQDSQGQWLYAYLVMNLSDLDRTANDWGSWKEGSTFHSAKGYSVKVTLESPQNDTVENALQFIFLHELGHALGLHLKAHDFWVGNFVGPLTTQSPFFKVSWQQDKPGRLVTPWRKTYPLLAQLRFYAFENAPLGMNQAEEVYQNLSQTDFPSLYGATHPLEDFAESVAIYLHTQVLKKPYSVQVLKDGQVVAVYKSCITENRCPAKVKAIQDVLGL